MSRAAPLVDEIANEREASEPQIVHALPGRVRVHLPEWTGAQPQQVEQRALAVRGVRRAQASAATRNLLVHFETGVTDDAAILEALGAQAPPSDAAPPSHEGPARGEPSAGEPEPGAPDPAAAFQSVARLAGAALGLGFLTTRRLLGHIGPPAVSDAPFVTAAALSVADGVPPLRRAVRGVVGDGPATLVLGNVAVAAQTLAGKTVSLAVGTGNALRALTAERTRSSAWHAYHDAARDGSPPPAGERIRLTGGEWLPTAGVVVEGCGTVTSPCGLPQPLAPGAQAPAGGLVHGGDVLVELSGPPPAEPRAGPDPRPALNDRYRDVAGLAAVGVALAAGVVTRSLPAGLVALQLLNPRPAAHARQSADYGATARAVRGGAVVLRPSDRRLRSPDVLLVAAPRVLVDGLEVVRALPLSDDCSASEVLRLAGEVSIAAGSPWGHGLPAAPADAATGASFDGTTAAATLEGRAYELALLADPTPGDGDPGTVALRLAGEGGALGVVVLHPRLASEAEALAQQCRRHGVVPALLCQSDDEVAAGLADRAGLQRIDDVNAVEAVSALRSRGSRVAVLDDSVEGGPAFAAADLAIALAPVRGAPYAAGADVLVFDLATVAAVLDASARAGTAERDGTLFAMVANAAGMLWAVRGTPTVRNASKYVTYASAAGLVTSFLRLAGGARPVDSRSR